MLCVRCKKRTAVVFVQRMDNGKPVQEGYCLTCATGALDCWLLALLLWFIACVTAGSLEFLTLNVLDQSVGYGIFGAFNPFLTHY